MKKRILFIIDSFNCGGAEKSLSSLLSLLSREKYDINIWALAAKGEFLSLMPEDVHIVAQPKYSAAESLMMIFGRLLFSFSLRRNRLFGRREHEAETLWKCRGWAMKVPQGKWDAVFAYQQGVPTYLVATKFENCNKLAWVNTDIFKAGYNTDFNTRFYREFHHICPVSESLKRIMMDRMPELKDKYITIYDIVNPGLIRQMARKKTLKLRTKADEYVFVTTGRLAGPKGYDIALRAASELKKMELNFKWYFIGEGPGRHNIERMTNELGLKENVVLLGFRSNPYNLMAQADVYVQTSRNEGFCLSIAEAKILCKPTISTDFDAVHNQIIHKKNGLIAQMNGRSVAENIYRMITDDKLRNTIIAEVVKEDNTTYLTEKAKVEQLIDGYDENKDDYLSRCI